CPIIRHHCGMPYPLIEHGGLRTPVVGATGMAWSSDRPVRIGKATDKWMLEFGPMPHVSIRARLIFLSVLLLAILAVSSALLIGQLARGSKDLAEQARLVS